MPVGSPEVWNVGETVATVSLERTNLPLQFELVHAGIAPHAAPLGMVHDQLICVTELKPLPVRLIVVGKVLPV